MNPGGGVTECGSDKLMPTYCYIQRGRCAVECERQVVTC